MLPTLRPHQESSGSHFPLVFGPASGSRAGFLSGSLSFGAGLLLSLVLVACEVFQFSPYQTNMPESRRNLTAKQITRLELSPSASSDTFTFAVLGDPGRQTDGLGKAITHINRNPDIAFVLVAGDLTQYGLRKEYQWLLDQLEKLHHPFLTTIGNHDAVANGSELYLRVFGPYEYTFTYGNSKFVVLNTNRWEFSFPVPDFPWLEKALSEREGKQHLFAFAHIAPFGDQFDTPSEKRYAELMRTHNVAISIHGHNHNHYEDQRYGDGVKYLLADVVSNRNYPLVHVIGDSIRVERVWF